LVEGEIPPQHPEKTVLRVKSLLNTQRKVCRGCNPSSTPRESFVEGELPSSTPRESCVDGELPSSAPRENFVESEINFPPSYI
jgi:hypothetical protein